MINTEFEMYNFEEDAFDTSKLCKGMVVKNYIDMCQLLNQKVQAGNSKKSQVLNWQRYFDFGRQGKKYIIEEIYEVPIPLTYNNNAVYVKIIEILLMHELYTKDNYTCEYTKTGLFSLLGMINANYNNGNKYNLIKEKLPEYKYEHWEINHFYMRTSQKLTGILFSALNSMQRRHLIIYRQQHIIVQDRNFSVATNKQCQNILAVEKTISDEMGYSVVPYSKLEEYYNKVNERLNELYDWDYVYKDFLIIYNQKFMLHDLSIVEGEIQKEISEKRLALNFEVVKAINKQAEDLYQKNMDGYEILKEDYERQLEALGVPFYEKEDMRRYFKYPPDYIEKQKALVELLSELFSGKVIK